MLLNHKTFGNPLHEALIIIHGMFGTLDNWQTVAKLLSERYYVIIVDLRNHGRSAHSDEFSYPIMAQDIRELMDELILRQAHIVGHSMGGKVAMQLALTTPEYVDKLVITDIAPKTYAGHHGEVFKAMFAIDPSALQSRQEAEEILKTHLPNDPATQQFILKNLVLDRETGKYAWRMNLPVIYSHYAHILGHEDTPAVFVGETLFVRGELSGYVSDADFEKCKQNFPKAELITIPRAGHWVHADQPLLFVEAVLNFIG